MAFISPSFVFAVILTSPAPKVTTFPSASTVAILVLLLSHIIDLSVAFSGNTVAVSFKELPFSICASVLSNFISVTAIVDGISKLSLSDKK